MFLAFFAYLTITAIFTWPLILHPTTYLYGLPGHPFAVLWRFWNFKYALLNHLPQNFTDRLAAPFGNPILDFLDPPLTFGLGKIITLLTNEVFAYNFLIFISFPLAGIFTYWLVFYLIKNKWASFIAGLIFAFAPYHTIHGIYHLTLSQIQYLPLFVLALLMLRDKPTLKRSLFVSFAFLLNAASDFYYGYICFLIFCFYGLYSVTQLFFVNKLLLKCKKPVAATFRSPPGNNLWSGQNTEITDQKQSNGNLVLKFLKYFSFSALFILISSLIIFYPVFSIKICSLNFLNGNSICQKIISLEYQNLLKEGQTKIPPKRSIEEVLAFSSRPWDYFIPSIEHPIFGQFSKNLYDRIKSISRISNDYRVTSTFPSERAVYLGFVPLILALTAIIFRKYNSRIWANFPRIKANAANICFFVSLFLCFFALSLPAFIYFRGIKFLFPSYFLFKLFPMFRSYVRMGVIVILMTAVLAGFGIKIICNTINRNHSNLVPIFLLFISYFILLEFTIIPPFHTTDISKIPPSYQWIRSQPGDFIIAEYPKDPRYEYEKFFVRYHQKRIFAPFSVSYFDEGVTIDNELWEKIKILDEETIKVLRIYDIKYVIIHTKEVFKNYQGAIMGPLTDPPDGLKLIKQFPEAQIFEIEQERVFTENPSLTIL